MGQGGSMETGEELMEELERSISGDEGDSSRDGLVTFPLVDSSDDESRGLGDLQDNTFREILAAVLVGRSSMSVLRSTIGAARQRAAETSGSEDSDTQEDLLRYKPQPPPPQNHPPDLSRLISSEIYSMTEQASQPTPRGRWGQGRGAANIHHNLLHRGLYGGFSIQERRSLCSSFLPTNCDMVARYKNKVFCGTYAKDGDIFMTACQDQLIRLYDTRCGRFDLFKTIQARDVGWSVLDVVVSPDGDHLVYSSWSDNLHQVTLDGGHQDVLPLNAGDRQFAIFSLSFSQDGSEILGGANDGHVYLYDRASNKQTLRVSTHDDDVNAVCFVDETTHVLASGGDDGLVKVWDRRALREDDPKAVGVLAGHIDGLTYIDPRGDGRHLITNSKDQSIKLWDIRMFADRSTISQSKRAVSSQRWDYRWQRVPKSICKSKRKVEGDTSVMTYVGHTVLQTLIRCHFSPVYTTGQRYLYTGCATGKVVIYDLLTGDIVKELQGHQSCVRDVSWHPYNMEICSSSWDYTVTRWEGVDNEDEDDELREKSSKKVKKRRKMGDRRCEV